MKKLDLGIVTEFENNLCIFFANECVKTNIDKYKKRKQFDSIKITKDIFNGKIAEILIYKLLKHRDKKPHPVDFLVYDKNSKSFDADIYLDNGSKIHVKSCLDKKLGSYIENSWVFQPEDKLITSPCDNDFLALVVLGDCNYCYIVKADSVTYEDPVKKELKKKVVYERTLIK